MFGQSDQFNASLIPTGTPGEFALPGLGRRIKLVEWEVRDVYDSRAMPAGETLTAIGEVRFFVDIGGKAVRDTNLTKEAQVPARHELIVTKPSIFASPMWGTSYSQLSDQLALISEGTYQLDKNERPLINETHMWGLQSGYGFVAYGVDHAAPVPTVAPGSNGVASPAAIPPMLVPFVLTPADSFRVIVSYRNSGATEPLGAGPTTPTFASYTLVRDTLLMAILHGFMKSPGTR